MSNGEHKRASAGEPKVSDALSINQIVSRTVTGSAFNVVSQGLTLVLGFVRSTILARLLVPEDFGIVALALFFSNLIASIATFGLNGAMIQRHKLEPAAISTHFAMRLTLMLAGVVLTLLAIPLFNYFYPDRPLLVPILLTLMVVNAVNAATSTPNVLLERRLAFRRLAILDILSSATMLVVASYLAISGWGPWSLVLGEQLAGALVSAVGVWVYRPPWRPSFHIDRSIARQYLQFGRYVLASLQITYLLDQFDDFWTATALGSTAAGFYSKAYEYARYPRRVVARPFQSVFFSAYARLQQDRVRLSKAYYRLNSLVVRLGFLFSLILWLVAAEFIELLLTARWLPMITTFRLMIIYSLFDPLIVTAGNLMVAVGEPQLMTRIKLVQLAVFIPSVLLLANWGIEGVAIAADLMLFTGIISIFRRVRRFVDFSLRRLFAVPLLALVLGAAAGFVAQAQVNPANLALSLVAKALAAAAVYVTILLLFEQSEYRSNLKTIARLLGPRC
ncbi:MAG: lipopolysaccharide biosynthesis protein [Anaerolineae bacterium]|nr:lipopolysaccharide biosynthesis protein [Anaerolineae bacterium]